MGDFRIAAAGDAAWLVEWPSRIDPVISGRAFLLADRARHFHPAVRDAVVGYCSLTVYFDPLRIDGDDLESQLRRLTDDLPEAAETNGAQIDVEVCYGGEFGPDLTDVAARAGLGEADVIALHAGRTYR